MKKETGILSPKKRAVLAGALSVAKKSLATKLYGWVKVGDVWYTSGKSVSRTLVYHTFHELCRDSIAEPFSTPEDTNFTIIRFTRNGLKKLGFLIVAKQAETKSISNDGVRDQELSSLEVVERLCKEMSILLNCY